MRVVLINKSDATGGAAVVSMRLMEALRDCGVDARMLVCEKLTDSPYVEVAAPEWRIKSSFLAERLRVFTANGLSRRNLFKVDPATDGLPLWRHPLVKGADAVLLNWVNQGMLSLHGVRHILALGKRVIWTMHDMWNMTGICHHAGQCTRWLSNCGQCPFLGPCASHSDLSRRVWRRKRSLYNLPGADLRFVAVSNWLARKAGESSLLGGLPLEVIPNAFPVPRVVDRPYRRDGRFRILIGAARLDDPVKGLPELLRTMEAFRQKYPSLATRTELVSFGSLRDPDALASVAVAHRHIGPVPPAQVPQLYLGSDVVISTSLYETLPGTLVEGQFYGAVPVAFDRGGQSDIIHHLQTGWLTSWYESESERASAMADGLAWAAECGNETRTLMFERARSKFSASTVAAEYIRLIGDKH